MKVYTKTTSQKVIKKKKKIIHIFQSKVMKCLLKMNTYFSHTWKQTYIQTVCISLPQFMGAAVSYPFWSTIR